MDFARTTLAFIDGLGGPEMLLVFVIVLVLFGGKKMPEFARGLGKTMREFKKAASGVEEEFKCALDEDERKQHALTAASTATAADATTSTPSANPDGGPSADAYGSPDEYGNYNYGDPDTPSGAEPAPDANNATAAASTEATPDATSEVPVTAGASAEGEAAASEPANNANPPPPPEPSAAPPAPAAPPEEEVKKTP